MRTVQGKRLLLCALAGFLLTSTTGADAADGPRERAGGERAAGARSRLPEGASALVYRATGVRDAATASTVVTCTSLDVSLTTTVSVFIYEFDGGKGVPDCELSVAVDPFTSRTVATRSTSIYVEDATCAKAPETEQGDLEIDANPAVRLICTVQIVDPVAATPVYATTLDLHRP